MPSVEKIRLLANYLGVTTSELLGEETGASPGAVRISVLGTIPAGIPIDAVEDVLDWEEIPASWTTGDREYFGLRVKGDSMYPRYLEGDTVILRKQNTCDSGDDCAVLVNGNDATLKQVILRGDRGLELRPVN
ncbi:S24 family peptidase, partial [Intestinimonas aquisgranensis]